MKKTTFEINEIDEKYKNEREKYHWKNGKVVKKKNKKLGITQGTLVQTSFNNTLEPFSMRCMHKKAAAQIQIFYTYR